MEQISTQDLLDRILDESVRTSARRPIMIQFDPASKAIWRHWKGTVFAETWKSAASHALWACLVYIMFQRYQHIQETFVGFQTLWGQMLAVTTFTLTFFVNQSYTLWRTCLGVCRALQGRLNDLALSLAGSAQRVDPTTPNGISQFTPQSKKILQVVARYVRLFNLLSYASFTRSHRPLLTPSGMRRMVSRGLMTDKERQALRSASIPATQRHNAVLMWIFRVVVEGRRAGHIEGGFGFEQQLLERVQEIRGQANSIEGELKGRMPFAYAHIVQVLVDAILWLYPVMAYSSGMSFQLGLVGSIFLTTCYQGLFDLAKQFLDPFHNENFWQGDDPLVVDTLIAETNAGSVRWMNALETMPIPYQSIRRGYLDEYILPEEGYTPAEAARMEAEKLEEAANMTQTLTFEDYQKRSAELIESAEDELAETQAIMNAPPGLDFVPGLDDGGESLVYHLRYSNRTHSTLVPDEGTELDRMGAFEQFMDVAKGEYLGKQSEFMGDNNSTNATAATEMDTVNGDYEILTAV